MIATTLIKPPARMTPSAMLSFLPIFMKKVIIDINILLDYFNKRKNHFEAAIILGLAEKKKIKLHLCAHEVTTLSYFLQKNKNEYKKFADALNFIFKISKVLPVTEKFMVETFLKINEFTEDYKWT